MAFVSSSRTHHNYTYLLYRIRTERNELRQIVPELSQKSAHLKEVEVLYEQCQQKPIAQTAVIENQQKVNLYTVYVHIMYSS